MHYFEWLDKYRPDVAMRKRVGRSKEFFDNERFVKDSYNEMITGSYHLDRRNRDIDLKAMLVIDKIDFGDSGLFSTDIAVGADTKPFTREHMAVALAYRLVMKGWKATPYYCEHRCTWLVKMVYGRIY